MLGWKTRIKERDGHLSAEGRNTGGKSEKRGGDSSSCRFYMSAEAISLSKPFFVWETH